MKRVHFRFYVYLNFFIVSYRNKIKRPHLGQFTLGSVCQVFRSVTDVF